MEFIRLTTLEQAIVVNISHGKTIKEMTEPMGMKHWKIDNHINEMLKKFGVRNSTELACFCIRNKYIE